MAPGLLEVRKCTSDDTGLYNCTVSNKWGTSTRTFKLTVAEGSKINNGQFVPLLHGWPLAFIEMCTLYSKSILVVSTDIKVNLTVSCF